MRKAITLMLLVVLGISSFGAMINLVSAQESTEAANPAIYVRWLRFRGRVNEWGGESYHGSLTLNAKTVNAPTVWYRQWASVRVIWSNEQRPLASDIKPIEDFTYTHYTARLVWLIAIRTKQEGFNLNLTGVWNVNQVKATYQFDDDGTLVKIIREVTPIATRAKGQLHILDGWKKFELAIEGIDTLKGVGFAMITTRATINPFSWEAGSTPTLKDLVEVVRCFRAMPGFGNYVHELDYNSDSKIDTADLTTVAANM